MYFHGDDIKINLCESDLDVGNLAKGESTVVKFFFQTPSLPGKYRTVWRLFSEEAGYFGAECIFEFQVQEEPMPPAFASKEALLDFSEMLHSNKSQLVVLESVSLKDSAEGEQSAPSSSAAKAPRTEFEKKLFDLEEMGFSNRDTNIQLLIKHRNDMVLVVQDLLNLVFASSN
jgi:hypothetical protein